MDLIWAASPGLRRWTARGVRGAILKPKAILFARLAVLSMDAATLGGLH